MTLLKACVLPGVLCMSAVPAGGAVMVGPLPYRSASDSPFSGATHMYFHLEDFEDGLLNTPGVSASGGKAGMQPPWSLNDSVDADDGLVDGLGQGGRAYASSGPTPLTFTFSEAALGHLPVMVGIVWTDVGSSSEGFGRGRVLFEARDASGASLGAIGPVLVGDGSVAGGTEEDRFFGVI